VHRHLNPVDNIASECAAAVRY